MPEYVKSKLKILIPCLVALITDTYWLTWMSIRYPNPSPMWVITTIWSWLAGIALLIAVMVYCIAIIAYYDED